MYKIAPYMWQIHISVIALCEIAKKKKKISFSNTFFYKNVWYALSKIQL